MQSPLVLRYFLEGVDLEIQKLLTSKACSTKKQESRWDESTSLLEISLQRSIRLV